MLSMADRVSILQGQFVRLSHEFAACFVVIEVRENTSSENEGISFTDDHDGDGSIPKGCQILRVVKLRLTPIRKQEYGLREELT
jgi:hypothetical protein